MTTDERKTLLDIRNQLVAQLDRIDALMEIKEQPKPKPKEERVMPPGLKRIWTLFHKETTEPTPKVFNAYNKLARRLGKNELYAQIDTMVLFYSFRKRKLPTETDYWSHDAYTLINNWDKKEATAKEFLKGKPTSVAKPPAEKIPEPKGNWRSRAKVEYGTSRNWDATKWTDMNDFPEVQKRITELTR
jgi:hypothetical protein